MMLRIWTSSGRSEVEPLLRPKMPELDSLRGLAILMVLFFHGFASRYSLPSLSGLPKVLLRVAGFGWTGVNLFFVLSGFLITGILLDSKHRGQYYRRFYVRRALRILPAFYALLMLLAAFGDFGLYLDHFSWSFLGLCSVYLANVTMFFGVPMQFGVLWSLAVEEHFYLVWPMIVRNLRHTTLMFVAIGIGVGSALARMASFWLGYNPFSHCTWLVADGLALGSLLAIILRGGSQKRDRAKWLALGTTLLGLLLLLISHSVHPAFAGGSLDISALNLFCTAFVAVTLLLGSNLYSFMVNNKVLGFFGTISYGLYLIHMLVFNLFDNSKQHFFPSLPPFAGHLGLITFRFIICTVISVLIAVLSRKYFEESFLRLKDRLTLASPSDTGSQTALAIPQS